MDTDRSRVHPWLAISLQHLQPSCHVHRDFARFTGHIRSEALSSWPADVNLTRRLWGSEHLDCAILRPITAACVDFSHWPGLAPKLKAETRADRGGICRRPNQAHSQPRFGSF